MMIGHGLLTKMNTLTFTFGRGKLHLFTSSHTLIPKVMKLSDFLKTSDSIRPSVQNIDFKIKQCTQYVNK